MNCVECKNTGVLPTIVFYTITSESRQRFCDCRIGNQAFQTYLRSEEAQKRIKQKKFLIIQRYLRISELPSFSNQKLDSSQKSYIDSYLKNFNYKTSKGIYLWSRKSGNGKTRIMAELCKEIITYHQFSCIFLSEMSIYQRLRNTFSDPQASENIIAKLKNVYCLFIDDFGAFKTTQWRYETLFLLLESRFRNNRLTFFSSDYSLEQYTKQLRLVTHCPDKLPSKIARNCHIIHVS